MQLLIAITGAMLVGFFVGQWKAESTHTEELQKVVAYYRSSNDSMRVATVELQNELQAINEKLRDEKLNIYNMRINLDSASKRLRVAATCTNVPAVASPPTATDTRGACELDPTARSNYLAFRRAYAEQFAILKRCQVYVRNLPK